MSVRERWIAIYHAAATGTRRTRTLLTPVGLLIFAAYTTLFVFLGIVVDRVLNLPGLIPDEARLPVAVPVTAVGVIAVLWSALHFLRVRGTPVPFNPPPKLVTTGPYRYARNPMLTGVFLVLFGLGFGFNSLSMLLVFTPAYILLNVWELKHVEEPELVKRLGEEYVQYRRQTPMFVPGLRKAKGG